MVGCLQNGTGLPVDDGSIPPGANNAFDERHFIVVAVTPFTTHSARDDGLYSEEPYNARVLCEVRRRWWGE